MSKRRRDQNRPSQVEAKQNALARNRRRRASLYDQWKAQGESIHALDAEAAELAEDLDLELDADRAADHVENPELPPSLP